jgi:hypothetical protein
MTTVQRTSPLPGFLMPLVGIALLFTALAGVAGIMSVIASVIASVLRSADTSALWLIFTFPFSIAMVAIPIRLMLKRTWSSTPRMILALTAFYFGGFGLDLMFMGREQKLFLGIALAMAGASLLVGILAGVFDNLSLLFLAAIPGALLGLWQIARFFELLWMSDEDFEKLLRGEYAG